MFVFYSAYSWFSYDVVNIIAKVKKILKAPESSFKSAV